MHGAYCADAYKQAMIEKYFDTVYRLALSQTKDRYRADDVLQDVFLRYIKTDKDFESEEHVKAWLIRVTVNCCKSTFTNSWFKKTVPLSEDLVLKRPNSTMCTPQWKNSPKNTERSFTCSTLRTCPSKQ